MRSLVLLNAGPNWVPGNVGNQDKAVMHAHLVRMRALYDKGVLLFGGPSRKNQGGMALIEAPSGADAASIMTGDPAVLAGIMVFQVIELSAYFDAFAGSAWPTRKSDPAPR